MTILVDIMETHVRLDVVGKGSVGPFRGRA